MAEKLNTENPRWLKVLASSCLYIVGAALVLTATALVLAICWKIGISLWGWVS